VNKQVRRLAIVAIVLLAALIVATTYWQTWATAGLQDRQDNAIQRVVQFTIARGLIYSANQKKALAINRRRRHGSQTFYFRHYPLGGLAAQTIGYSTLSRSQTGLEESLNDYLTGSNTNLSNAFRHVLDRLGNATVHGASVETTIRPGAQQLAQRLLGDQCGAVVAMNPHTGAVYVMASSPTYNSNLVGQPGGFAKVLRIRGACGNSSALLNRATQGLFTPGSTFKMVTAAAALDSGKFTPTSSFDDPGYCVEYGKPVYNAGNPDQQGPEAYGRVDLAQGFEHSINSVFCNIGKTLGAQTIVNYAKRFGFYRTPPLETPSSQRRPSGLYKPNGQLQQNAALADPGRLAFGQSTMLVTPLQMAMVASTIANHGVVPKPYVVQKIVASDGTVIRETKPETLGRAISPKTAAELKDMMVSVVVGGTGTHAQIPGIEVAGKTGTAETGIPRVYTAWFVCFAPAEHAQVAVAVVLEKQLNGFGGAVSAPIAKQVLEALLAR